MYSSCWRFIAVNAGVFCVRVTKNIQFAIILRIFYPNSFNAGCVIWGRLLHLSANILCLSEQTKTIMRGLILATIMTLGLAAQAQENFKEPFIEVSGVSEMEIDPNEIVLWIRLKEFEENKNKVQLEKIDQRFLNALKEAGIDKKRLTLADAGATLSKVTKRDKEAFREKTYELTLTGSAELERFLSASAPVEIDNMRVTRVDHTDIEKYKLEAKTKALQIAKNKAQVLAESIGSG